MKIGVSLLIALFLAASLQADSGCEITVKLDYYTYDTLWFGTSFGKRAVPNFAATRQTDGTFLLKTSQPLEQGMYAIIYKRNPNASLQFFQCWLVDGQRKFSIATNISLPYERPVIVGSSENEALFAYLRLLGYAERRLDEAVEQARYLQNEEKFRQQVRMEEALRHLQDSIFENAKSPFTQRLIQQTYFPIPPPAAAQGSDWKQEARERWQYQRAHYFANGNIATPDFTRHLQWLDRTDFFLLSLAPADPDTVKALVDLVLKRLEAYPEGFDYYQKYLTNSFTKLSKYRNDEVYVHLVRNYLEAGKAAWASANDVRNATSTARQMEMLFDGSAAPPVTMFDQENQPVNLYDISAKITLLLFYMPDCSHCKKEIPAIAGLYDRYQERGLKVAAVCLKTGADTQKCWEFTDSQTLPKDWYLLADPSRKANLATMFNVRSYPKLLLLDADKKILFKQNGEMPMWQLEAILDRLLY